MDDIYKQPDLESLIDDPIYQSYVMLDLQYALNIADQERKAKADALFIADQERKAKADALIIADQARKAEEDALFIADQ
ncbi:MAG: hypothetical protein OMM_13405, partial [Candidatus Magnetoglobus multicellularis str. Araruama]